ncbi:MAG: transglycosylase SLT domain-containing protein [Staphylococcus sp.]|nr:transglycosylase SLT domain-containing protein [Staphylococcus sp.]
MKKSILATLLAVGLSTFCTINARSILDIKQSITDDNIIAPESFETQTRLLEENFYLKNYVVPGVDLGNGQNATPREYEERLKVLPTVIEMPYNSIVGNFINMYLNKKRGLVADMLALHSYYGPIFVEELIKEGMPTELQYLPVIESAIDPNAISRAGAAGLWQFMPATAKGLGMEVNSLVDERRDPRLSSRNAARYLKQLYEIYNDWSLAIAAYNCGPGNVNKALRRAGEGKKDFWEIYEYLPAETRGYVPVFIAANYVMNYYPKHGISPTIIKRHLTTDTVVVDKYVHFNQIAAVLNIPVDEIRMLNPQYLKDIIPGDYRPYTLTLPTQQCLSYVMSEKRIVDYDAELYARRSHVEPGANDAPVLPVSDNGAANLAQASQQTLNAEANQEIAQAQVTERMTVKTHVVSRGENIRDIARHYGVSATDIKRWNQLRRGKVKEGDKLKIEVFERVSPEEVKVVAAPEVAQVSPQELREAVTSESQTSGSTASAATTKAAAAPAKTAAPAKKATTTAKKNTQSAAPRSHKVKSGDTLGALARKYGTTVAAIQAANGMGKSTSLRAGQTIKIPAKKATSSRRRRR